MLQQHQEPGLEILLQKRRHALRPLIGRLLNLQESGRMPPLDEFAGSHIHMMLNRVLKSDARLQEWILYDFMSRHYQSVIARKNPGRQVPVD